MTRHVGSAVTPPAPHQTGYLQQQLERDQDLLTTNQPYARVGRYLSLVALWIYLSRDWVTDPENKILMGGGCRGPSKLDFSSYLF